MGFISNELPPERFSYAYIKWGYHRDSLVYKEETSLMNLVLERISLTRQHSLRKIIFTVYIFSNEKTLLAFDRCKILYNVNTGDFSPLKLDV